MTVRSDGRPDSQDSGAAAEAARVERTLEEVERQAREHVAEAVLVKSGEPEGSRLAGKAVVGERGPDGEDKVIDREDRVIDGQDLE